MYTGLDHSSTVRGRTGRTIIVVLVLAFSSTTFLVGEENVSALTPRGPISIVGNGQFGPANGVSSGTGTPLDPYIIEGWEINSTADIGIQIRDTDAHFVVRDSLVHGAWTFEGIWLDNVRNGQIVNASATNNAIGVFISSSSNVSVVGSTGWQNGVGEVGISFSDNVTLRDNNVTTWIGGEAIRVEFSQDVTLLNNSLVGNGVVGLRIRDSLRSSLQANSLVSNGIFLSGMAVSHYTTHTIPTNNTVNGNPIRYHKDCTNLTYDGVAVGQFLFANCQNLSLRNATISNTSPAIQLAFVTNATIRQLDIAQSGFGLYAISSDDISMIETNVSGGGRGIEAVSVTGMLLNRNNYSGNSIGVNLGGSPALVTSNTFYNNWRGIFVGGNPSTIHHNNFLSNTAHVGVSGGVEVGWDDGYPSGGNFWDDYGGSDICRGPLQTICDAADGLGDTPYVIDGDSQDRYPLMQPAEPRAEWIPPIAPTVTAAELTGASLSNLTISWNRSADESAPGGTLEYRVERSLGNLSEPFISLATLAVTGAVEYNYTCVGCGHNLSDPDRQFFRVVAADAENNTAVSNLAARHVEVVQPGTTILTVPLHISNMSVSAVLRTVAHAQVRTYLTSDASDPWKAHYPGRPGDLTALEFGSAFYVRLTSLGHYTLAGLVEPNPEISLVPGWNLVAYASFRPEAVNVSLAGVPGVTQVEGLGDPADPYGLRAVGSNEILVPAGAYWVFVSGPGGLWMQA